MNAKTITITSVEDCDKAMEAIGRRFDEGQISDEESNRQIETMQALKNTIAAELARGVTGPSSAADQHGLTQNDWETIRAYEAVERNRSEAGELQRKFIATLPMASDAQMVEVLAQARAEAETLEGFKVNLDFRLSEQQVAAVRRVRAERVAFCTANKVELLASVGAAEHRLTSYKVRVGSKRTVTTLRFERTMGQAVKRAPVGLIADLRAKIGK